MTLTGGMIAAGRFNEFVGNVVQWHNEEKEEAATWEVWLHKVIDQGYNDFKASLGMNNKKSAAPTKNEQIAAVQRSMKILGGCHPVEAGGNGAIQNLRDDSR